MVGIISERDVYRLLERFLPQPQKEQIRARDMMIADPYVVSFDARSTRLLLKWQNAT